MFLHIGEDVNVLLKDVVIIMDKDSLEKSKTNKLFIEENSDEENLIDDNVKNIKTYIITCSNNSRKNRRFSRKNRVYTSNISSTTLLKRNE